MATTSFAPNAAPTVPLTMGVVSSVVLPEATVTGVPADPVEPLVLTSSLTAVMAARVVTGCTCADAA